jgi:hypothetical protein
VRGVLEVAFLPIADLLVAFLLVAFLLLAFLLPVPLPTELGDLRLREDLFLPIEPLSSLRLRSTTLECR